jgi:putative nucleotidyltransferase with HDIG domain
MGITSGWHRNIKFLVTMKLRTTFLSSKVARRFFFLFVSCALLPITLLAAVAFFQVSQQLRSESERQLAQASKAQGMAIYERLAMLDAEMQVLSFQSRERKSLMFDDALKVHFLGMTMVNHDGEPIAEWGDPPKLSTFTPKEKLHLESGKALIGVHPCSNQFGSCVAMIRLTDPGRLATGMLAGEISLDYLWDAQKLPPGLEFCALAPSRAVLFCTDPGTTLSGSYLPRPSHASGSFQWTNRETPYDAAYWSLLLKPAFLIDSWTIVLSQKRDDVLAPMRHFRNTFPLIILLALWIVMLFSLMQIRRTLVPLEKLQEGTRQIGAQHFESRVDVRSGDEFEALAVSFNSMASQLGRQFHVLKTINDIDQAIFASLSREGILDATLDHMPDLLPCDCFAITLFGDADSLGKTQLRAVRTGQPEATALDTQVASADLQQLQEHREVLAISEGETIPGFILPLRETGMTSFLILPIIVDNVVFAALVCAHGSVLQIAADDIQQVRQVADQLAVAFSNVQLIEALEELHWGTLTALARAIDAKSAWTAGHSERVTNLALRIGRAMGLSAKDLQIMHRGGLLHDIGKIGTPPTILDKPGKLEPDETRIMQDHVRIGLRILEPIAGFREALPIVSQHHERFDGLGYPEGLARENISLHARIFAVADCYDAITSDRPYRKGLPKEKTLEIMKQGSGTQFDPKIVEVFIRLCAEDKAWPLEQPSRAAVVGQSG